MAIENLAAIVAAYAELLGPRVTGQMNRQAPLLGRLRKEGEGGPTCAWDVTMSGATAGTFAEGADVADGDIAQDTDLMATLAWGEYRSNFGMTGKAKAVAQSAGTSPPALVNRFAKDLMASAQELGRTLNGACYTGSGSEAIIGLQTALSATGSYAGINKATYAEWAGNEDGNSGTPRPLTKTIIDTMEAKIFKRSGKRFDIAVTTPESATKYESLFDAQKQVININTNDLSVSGAQGGGVNYNVEAGETGLTYKGVGVLRDAECPAGHLFLINSDHIRVRYLPLIINNETGAVATLESILDGNAPSGLMAHLKRLGPSGDAEKWSLVVYPQLEINKVNAHGMIFDIDEAA